MASKLIKTLWVLILMPVFLRSQTVNPMDYGAIGNGTTNDAAAVQAALDAVTTGGTVHFTHMHAVGSASWVGLHMRQKNNVTIQGNGTGTGLKVLAIPTQIMHNTSVMKPTLKLMQSTGVTVTNMEFDGNAIKATLLGLDTMTNAVVSGNYFHNDNTGWSGETTDAYNHAITSMFGHGNQYLNNTISSTGRGIYIGHSFTGEDEYTPYAHGNTLWNTFGSSICGSFSGGRIDGNYVSHTKTIGSGIVIASGDEVTVANDTITNNDCHYCAWQGIQSDVWNDLIITNCVIDGNRSSHNLCDGIQIDEVRNWKITNNICWTNNSDNSGNGYGIQIVRGDSIWVLGNTCCDDSTVHTQVHGILVNASDYVNGVTNLTVSDNTTYSNKSYGIFLTRDVSGTMSNVTVSGNSCLSGEGTGIRIAAPISILTYTNNSCTPYPGTATKLAFDVQPTNTAANSTITPAVTVQVQDASSYPVISNSSASVTVAIGTNPDSGTLNGTKTVTASGGIATFSTLSINNTGTGYTLTASGPGLTGATSNTFIILVRDGTIPDSLVSGSTFSHGVVLRQGWNMISTFVAPDQPAFDSIFSNIKSKVAIVKDGLGKVYWPSLNINNLGSWQPSQGYQVYMNSAETVTFRGEVLPPEHNSISLPLGWNLVSYLRNDLMAADSALGTIGSSLIIAKNAAGEVYMPSYDINTMGTMKPGQGYQIYVQNPSALTYPANTNPTPSSVLSKKQSTSLASSSYEPEHFKVAYQETGANAIILVKCNSLKDGDEIAVSTGDGAIVGASVVRNGLAPITVWGDDAQTDVIEGARNGNNLTLLSWSKEHDRNNQVEIKSIKDALTGETQKKSLVYQKDELAVLEVSEVSQLNQIPTEYSLSQNYPNPFNPSTVIRYALPTEVKVRMDVFDISGRLVAVLVETTQKAGNHEVTFTNHDLATGVYFYRLQADAFSASRKLLLIR